jgi:hypothetical protein
MGEEELEVEISRKGMMHSGWEARAMGPTWLYM